MNIQNKQDVILKFSELDWYKIIWNEDDDKSVDPIWLAGHIKEFTNLKILKIISDLEKEFEIQKETYIDIVSITVKTASNYPEFLIWTKNRVYFYVTYDCGYWIESVPRNPCSEAVIAFGG